MKESIYIHTPWGLLESEVVVQVMRRLVMMAALAVAAAVGLGMVSAIALDTITRNGELVADGAWCWFQDARAVHYVGAHDRTYIGYVDSAGDIDIVSQDARTARLVHNRLHATLQYDDHAAPGLAILPGGKIFVAYSKHLNSPMYYRISTNPEDISAFGPERIVSANAVYANPIYLSAEHRLYLFFRDGVTIHPSVVSTTDYVHWTAQRDMILPQASYGRTRPYAKYATNGVNTISIAFTDGHPREDALHAKSTSLYAIGYKTGVGWHTPNGTALTLPVKIDELKSKPDAVVYQDPGAAPAWVSSTALDPSTGNPIVAYPTYKGLDPSDGWYHYARWNGASWVDSTFTNAGASIATANPVEMQYSGGMDIDRNDPNTVYVSRETTLTSGVWEIERWHTADGGHTLARQAIITPRPAVRNLRPVVPWGRPGEIKVLWMSGIYARGGTGYQTQLRESTTGLAPTTATLTVSAASIKYGKTVIVSGRIMQGYLGTGVAYAKVELWQHVSGQAPVLAVRATAAWSGVVNFSRRPLQNTWYTIKFQPTTNYSASTSPTRLVYVVR